MRALALLCLVATLITYVLGGTAPFGRLLLSANLPGMAAKLFEDPEWRGVAQYKAGAVSQARDAFSQARSLYNLGNAHTQTGNYAAALESYDIAIAQGHPNAQANFDVVAAFYAGLGIDPEALSLFPDRKTGPAEESFVAHGNARAAGSGSEVTNANTMLGLAELDSRGRLGVRRIFDDKFMVADERWLTQLSDVPGEFMKARISHEHKRRVKAGLSPPKAKDPQ